MSLWLVREMCIVDDVQTLASLQLLDSKRPIDIMREGHWAHCEFIALPLVERSGRFTPGTEARGQRWTVDNPAPRSH